MPARRVRALLHIDSDNLMFVAGDDGRPSDRRNRRRRRGRQRRRRQREERDHFGAQGSERHQRRRRHVFAAVPVPKPGGYQLRFAVRDTHSGAVGSAGEFVDVPDVRHGTFALSSVLLGAATWPSSPSTRPRQTTAQGRPSGSSILAISCSTPTRSTTPLATSMRRPASGATESNSSRRRPHPCKARRTRTAPRRRDAPSRFPAGVRRLRPANRRADRSSEEDVRRDNEGGFSREVGLGVGRQFQNCLLPTAYCLLCPATLLLWDGACGFCRRAVEGSAGAIATDGSRSSPIRRRPRRR